ncbi:MAG TPA: Rne/Rng family ribonuclease, partial [Planctomycetota bacterium]|nr:Rne/Rng family ribonuclease [Planctomycetota bacterium]
GAPRRRPADVEDDDDDLPAAASRVTRDQVIVVNAAGVHETRVAVVEKGRIVDLQMSVQGQDTYVNDIYRGRVVNLEPAIGAAFVDFGEGRNGFLHVSDVMEIYGEPDWTLDKILKARTDVEDWAAKGPKPEEFEGDDAEGGRAGKSSKAAPGGHVKRGRSRGRKRYAVGELLQKGQLVVCQITKDAIGDKGPTLTTYVSIPGRYLVLMPSLERTGVSRKIEDEKERRRLKRILQSLSIPEGMGVIVRTAGIGKTKAEIKRDLEYLLAVWETFSQRLVLGRAPAPLYQESDVAVRTMRDLFSSRTREVIVDDPQVFEHMREFTRRLMPEHEERIVLDESGRPLFHALGVEQDFEKIFSKRVELPSGGSIVIDQTEALVAIDVNSGRTRDDTTDFENIALKTNLEAAPEIARQIRLRDLGGILVVDFIDMVRMGNRRTVEKSFRDALAKDRARSKVGRISQFGLLELTRQRLGPGLDKLVYEPCTYCRGSGRRRTARSKADAVLRRLSAALQQKGFTRVEVQVHPDTLDYLRRHAQERLDRLVDLSKREIELRTSEEQLEDSIFHYLRADGREVRPGGRRKR